MEDEYQLTFDFDNLSAQENTENKEGKYQDDGIKLEQNLSQKDLVRATIAWFFNNNASSMGTFVPTRVSKYKADVAGFWSKPVYKKGKKVLYPLETSIVEIRSQREECWPDCAGKEETLKLLKQEKENKANFEKEIRETEPELKLDDTLFPEYEAWDYANSKNKDYLKCKRRIEELEQTLYKGSRFEKIRQAGVADFLYLAVPENTVHKHEIADGWGLLYINKDFQVTEIKKAENWESSLENKFHLVQNIARSNMNDLFFSNGIRINQNNEIYFTKIPKRRKK